MEQFGSTSLTAVVSHGQTTRLLVKTPRRCHAILHPHKRHANIASVSHFAQHCRSGCNVSRAGTHTTASASSDVMNDTDAVQQLQDRSRFSIQEAVDLFITVHGGRDAAVEALLALQASNSICMLGQQRKITEVLPTQWPTTQLAFTTQLPDAQFGTPLNGQFRWFGPARSAIQVSQDLRRRLLSLYGQYVDEDGKLVDYRALAASSEFADYKVAAAELQSVDVYSLTREQRLAFFVNVYNSLIIHGKTLANTANNPPARLAFFDKAQYIIAGQSYSSNDIEHGILRGNAPSPGSLGALLGKPQWRVLAPLWLADTDSRLPLVISPPDPRIHFALNCGAKSCPAIRVYSEDNVEGGLAAAARAFINSEVEVVPSEGKVVLSKIFQWYGRDFAASDEQLLRYILQYMKDEPKSMLQAMLDQGKRVKLMFKEYDWSDNAK